RSRAVGELARHQLALDLPDPHAADPAADPDGDHDGDPDGGAGQPAAAGQGAGRAAGRAVTLHVHVSADAITGHPSQGTDRTGPVSTGPVGYREPETLHLARVEESGTVVTAAQVAAWCGAPGTTKIIVKPVIDLAERVHVAQYEVPDRIAERTDLRDVH